MLVAHCLAADTAVKPVQPRVILKLRPVVATESAGGLPGFCVVAPAPGESVAAAAARLAALRGVEAAEIDSPVRITPLPAVKAPLAGISTQITSNIDCRANTSAPDAATVKDQASGNGRSI